MTDKKITTRDEMTEFLLYTAPGGGVKVEVFIHDESIWLPQKRMAELFGVGVPAVSKHLDNIYESGELERSATDSKMETVQQEGSRQVKRQVEFYNLDEASAQDADREAGWMQVFGKADTEAITNVQKTIDDEFSKIDPSDWQ